MATTVSTSPNNIDWFRNTGPYIRGHQGRTFVIYLGNGAVESAGFNNLIYDLALMHLLGIRLVLVHATRHAIDSALEERGIPGPLHRGVRVTDAAVLDVARDVTAAQRLSLESRLSMGLPDSPMRGARLRVVSGNFVTARPLGIVDGIDFQYTGAIRRLDAAGIVSALDNQGIVLLSPLGFSPTGEVFNLSADELATAAAIATGADKLIIMDREQGLRQPDGQLIRQCTVANARDVAPANELQAAHISAACTVCEQGVSRAHLVSFETDGALIAELFTHDGAGTLISDQEFELARRAGIDDIAGILELIKPLEESGVLVKRSRELLEQEIENFRVLDRDGRIIACAALYPFSDAGMAEVACIVTHNDYRGENRGEHLLSLLEQEAQSMAIDTLFVLTTQSSHWFQEQGFSEQPLSVLPSERQDLYNLQRNSKVLTRHIG